MTKAEAILTIRDVKCNPIISSRSQIFPIGFHNPRPEVPDTPNCVAASCNTSVNLSAEFAVVAREDNGILSGCMVVARPLFGSGPLTHFTADSEPSFVVTNEIGSISSSGKWNGQTIIGQYTVVRSDGRANEEGTFIAQVQVKWTAARF